MVNRIVRIVVIATLFFVNTVSHGNWVERAKLDFEYVDAIAREKSGQSWIPPREENPIPDALRSIDYSGYQRIRYNGGKAIWLNEHLPFLLMPMHPGYLFQDQVKLFEASESFIQPLRFNADLYFYDALSFDPRTLPDNLGFSGMQLSFRLNHPENFSEIAVFQGASYYRMLARNQVYGLSARGLAINTVVNGKLEEFPLFSQHWVVKPEKQDDELWVYSLLESESVTGAFLFKIKPGITTVADVKASLYFRALPESVGIAPMSSMFWFGEGSKERYDDYRPEVHDSDGLVIRSSGGECIWRPLQNDPQGIHISSFSFSEPVKFGLIQRDRDFGHYEDPEARYHLRPSLWIEPIEGWSEGVLRLMELPTRDETSDNIVVFWEPAKLPAQGEPLVIQYRQSWTMNGNPAEAGACVVSSRTGVLPWNPGRRLMVLEFDGRTINGLADSDPVEAVVTALDPSLILISDVTVHRNPENGCWRVSFLLEPSESNMDATYASEIDEIRQKQSQGEHVGIFPPRMLQAVELRAYLKLGEDVLSETWSWRVDR